MLTLPILTSGMTSFYPPPNCVIYNAEKGTPHYIYLLDNFVKVDNLKQLHKYKLIQKAYIDKLQADRGYAGQGS